VTEKSYWTIDIVDVELQWGEGESKSTGVCVAKPKDEGDPDGPKQNENNRCKAIVDTGTYLIYGPKESVTKNLEKVALTNGCSSITDLPKVTFVFWAGENQKPARLTLQPHDYTLEFIVPKAAYGGSSSGFIEEGAEDNQGLRGGMTMRAQQQAQAKHLQGTAHRLKKMKAEEYNCNSPENRKNTEICQQDCVIGIGPDNDPGWTLGQVFLRSFYTVFDRGTDKDGMGEGRVGFVRSNPRGDIERAQKAQPAGEPAIPMPPKPLYGSLQTPAGVVTDSGL
jgi:hypothetical protein